MSGSDRTPTLHRRKSLRAESWRYHWPGPYVVTIVLNGRVNRLGSVQNSVVHLSDAGEMVEHYWLELERKFIGLELDSYVIMPNHMHGILQLPPGAYDRGSRDRTLGDVIGWFKTMTTNAYIRGVKEDRWPRFERKFWQPEYWDHISRGPADIARVREYIENNPSQWEMDPDNSESHDAWI